jgi:hypothetical protein
MGILCPMYKQGDQNKCEGYRGIMLVSCIHNVLSWIISKQTDRICRKNYWCLLKWIQNRWGYS